MSPAMIMAWSVSAGGMARRAGLHFGISASKGVCGWSLLVGTSRSFAVRTPTSIAIDPEQSSVLSAVPTRQSDRFLPGPVPGFSDFLNRLSGVYSEPRCSLTY